MPLDAEPTQPIDAEPVTRDVPKWWVVKRCGTSSGPRHPTCEYGIIEATTRGRALHKLVVLAGTGLTADMTACGPFDTADLASASVRGQARHEDFTAREDVEYIPEEVRP